MWSLIVLADNSYLIVESKNIQEIDGKIAIAGTKTSGKVVLQERKFYLCKRQSTLQDLTGFI